jgi:hypothetical protein
LFTRPVTLSYRHYAENTIRETVLASGTLYRVALEGQPTAANLNFATDVSIPSRELIVAIHNGDSPPLEITAVEALRRPVYLTFLAPRAGTYTCLSGNSQSAMPRYDLAAQREHLQSAPLVSAEPGALTANPDYRPTDLLPEVQAGSELDTAAWKYRKRVPLTQAGVQQVDLDLEVLSHANPALQDLRLLGNGRQLPYLLERTAITRPIVAEVTPADDPQRPRVSRWVLRLPLAALPVSGLAVTTLAPYFKREVRLYEDVTDSRGVVHQRLLKQALWVRNLSQKDGQLTLVLPQHPLATDRLLLEIETGDNPPLKLEKVEAWTPLIRVLFKAPATTAEAFLYYGNRLAGSPQYDLDVIAPQFLAAEKNKATVESEETLQKPSWRDHSLVAGSAGVLFWITLAVVVGVLLWVIARLLPAGSASKDQE